MRVYDLSMIKTATLTLLALAVPVFACNGQEGADPRHAEFARLVGEFSEPGGFFDTDNLISNETSYLHVIDELETRGLKGGAYVGVGPGQNFSYIAQIDPEIAYIIDIRADNLLQHLIYKALFHQSDNRAEFVSLLLGLPLDGIPEGTENWSVDQLVDFIDGRFATRASIAEARDKVDSFIDRLGIPLVDTQRETIDRFHRTFIRAGLSLRFTTFGRAPQPYYPTLRQLFEATDLQGDRESYLASEESFRVVKTLQEAGRLIPVVGNFAGDHALGAVAADIRSRGLQLSAFYTSNVEFYLMEDGSFGRFASNLEVFPVDSSSVFIRSVFGSTSRFRHPGRQPGFASTQLVQSISDFQEAWGARRLRDYIDLVLLGFGLE